MGANRQYIVLPDPPRNQRHLHRVVDTVGRVCASRPASPAIGLRRLPSVAPSEQTHSTVRSRSPRPVTHSNPKALNSTNPTHPTDDMQREGCLPLTYSYFETTRGHFLSVSAAPPVRGCAGKSFAAERRRCGVLSLSGSRSALSAKQKTDAQGL
jgi:hypothetical protein